MRLISLLVIVLELVFVLAISTSSTTAVGDHQALLPQALPGCSDHCGNITIPYPFGMARGCYGRPEFFVNCTATPTTTTDINFKDLPPMPVYKLTSYIPSGLFPFEMVLELWYSNHLYSCSYGFFVEQGEFTFSPNISLQQLNKTSHLPLVLNWEIGDHGPCSSANNSTDFACKGNSTCVSWPNINGWSTGYICWCLPGYQGNPYHPDGCQAIGVMLVLLVGSAWSLCWGMKQRKYIKLKEKYFEENGGFLLQHKLASHHVVETTRICTAEELEKATNNYHDSRVLGKGSYGIVYKGILPDKKMVAIKKSRIAAPTQTEQFVNELVVLSQINHRNVVRLLGCCLESEVPLLVYEFITNGTLFEHIHGERSRGSSLVWELRLKIAAETAGALAYLHSSTFMQIINRDISQNCLVHQTQVVTLVQGTLGYLDPEYLHSNQLTEKSDVYSFGVVLVELLTSKVAISYDRPEAERKDRLERILDCRIVNKPNIETVRNVARLAKRCLRLKGEERPTMKDVAMELEGMRIVANHPWGSNVDLRSEDQTLLLSWPPSDASVADVRDDCGSTATTSGTTSS
ncbi:hypothetical protein PRUPE_4G094000 [Prunus persica]|uniref:Protein kinase domain-containing protein n=1 Tax=Prunus persica TaxID=3760 RepID=A0A251PJI9_PRUPE|nr:hypothetical protein PRUPE_4G094000 [Prunus persica]